MKTAFLTFEQHLGRKDIGSSRIRAKWPIKYWNQAGPDIGTAELFRMGEKYDAVIFQKAYWPEYARAFKGIKILDLCDPDWMHWGGKIVEMIQEVDVITCSSQALAKQITRFTDKPVYVVNDRIDFEQVKRTKVHVGDMKTVVWYGYSQNFPMLESTLGAIKKLGLNLIVIADKTFALPSGMKGIEVTNYPWSADHWVDDLLRGDVVLNPRHSKGRFKYKSDNKTTMAWALGLPVAHNEEELKAFITEESRKKEAEVRTKQMRDEYDVKLSVIDMKEIIGEIKDKAI